MGSLGYLCNFAFSEYKDTLTHVFDSNCELHLDKRLRLGVSVPESPMRKVFRGNNLTTSENMLVDGFNVVNEVVIDRGPSPYAI